MRKGFHRWNGLVGTTLAFLALLLFSTPAFAQSAIELRVKAAFVYNFAKFTKWPGAVPSSAEPFVIGCFGDPEFMEVLQTTVAGKTLEGRPIMVKSVAAADDLRTCRILFVGEGRPSKATALLREATMAHVLTVGASDNFTSSGGMIQFLLVDNGVKFAINQQQAELAGLKISSKLLELAVKDHHGGG